MNNKRTLGVVLVMVLLTGAVGASEPPRFPLVWQARSAPNADGSSVTRIHDPEAGVNCYVLAGNIIYTGSLGYGHVGAASISCVKVR